jgi:hypothetical protein
MEMALFQQYAEVQGVIFAGNPTRSDGSALRRFLQHVIEVTLGRVAGIGISIFYWFPS